MITIELESEGENRRGRLMAVKTPRRRRIFFWISLVLVALASYCVFVQDGNMVETLTRLLVVICAIPFVVWFFLSTKFTSTLGGFSETCHVVKGERKSFEYTLSTNAVIEKSEYGERKYPYSDFVRHEKLGCGNEQVVVFKKGLIYLPQYAIKQGSINAFIAKLEKHLSVNST